MTFGVVSLGFGPNGQLDQKSRSCFGVFARIVPIEGLEGL